MTLFNVFSCVARLAYAAAIFYAAVETLFTSPGHDLGTIYASGGTSWASSGLASLLVVVGIWLVFGVRTRVVALLGLALYVGHLVMLPGFSQVDQQTLIELALVTALALPLILFGGGRYSMFRAGWSDVM